MYVLTMFHDTEMSQWASQPSITDTKGRCPTFNTQIKDLDKKEPQIFLFRFSLLLEIPKLHDIAKEILVFIGQKAPMDSFP